MMAATDLMGLAGVVLVTATALSAGRRWRLVIFFSLLWLPFHGLPLAGYVRGLTGDLSIASLVFSLMTISRRSPPELMLSRRAWSGIAVLALTYYALALGGGAIDPYRWGYGEPRFLAALLIIAVLAIRRKTSVVAAIICVSILAWYGEMYESTNLWDYLIDPWIAVYVLFFRRRARGVPSHIINSS